MVFWDLPESVFVDICLLLDLKVLRQLRLVSHAEASLLIQEKIIRDFGVKPPPYEEARLDEYFLRIARSCRKSTINPETRPIIVNAEIWLPPALSPAEHYELLGEFCRCLAPDTPLYAYFVERAGTCEQLTSWPLYLTVAVKLGIQDRGLAEFMFHLAGLLRDRPSVRLALLRHSTAALLPWRGTPLGLLRSWVPLWRHLAAGGLPAEPCLWPQLLDLVLAVAGGPRPDQLARLAALLPPLLQVTSRGGLAAAAEAAADAAETGSWEARVRRLYLVSWAEGRLDSIVLALLSGPAPGIWAALPLLGLGEPPGLGVALWAALARLPYEAGGAADPLYLALAGAAGRGTPSLADVRPVLERLAAAPPRPPLLTTLLDTLAGLSLDLAPALSAFCAELLPAVAAESEAELALAGGIWILSQVGLHLHLPRTPLLRLCESAARTYVTLVPPRPVRSVAKTAAAKRRHEAPLRLIALAGGALKASEPVAAALAAACRQHLAEPLLALAEQAPALFAARCAPLLPLDCPALLPCLAAVTEEPARVWRAWQAAPGDLVPGVAPVLLRRGHHPPPASLAAVLPRLSPAEGRLLVAALPAPLPWPPGSADQLLAWRTAALSRWPDQAAAEALAEACVGRRAARALLLLATAWPQLVSPGTRAGAGLARAEPQKPRHLWRLACGVLAARHPDPRYAELFAAFVDGKFPRRPERAGRRQLRLETLEALAAGWGESRVAARLAEARAAPSRPDRPPLPATWQPWTPGPDTTPLSLH